MYLIDKLKKNLDIYICLYGLFVLYGMGYFLMKKNNNYKLKILNLYIIEVM